jgi:hypothetical protein
LRGKNKGRGIPGLENESFGNGRYLTIPDRFKSSCGFWPVQAAYTVTQKRTTRPKAKLRPNAIHRGENTQSQEIFHTAVIFKQARIEEITDKKMMNGTGDFDCS